MSEENITPFHRFDSLHFGVYTSKEILELSVKEVTNPQTFDSLSHPTFGGLYDPALGPEERFDACTTCGLGTLHCPGHMGHIMLPLPVYNPILFQTLYRLLRGTCFGCKRMRVKPIDSTIFQCQMRLLDHGLVSEAEHLRSGHHSFKQEIAFGDLDKVLLSLEEYTIKHLKALPDLAEAKNTSKVKHVTESRQQIVKQFLHGTYFNNSCPYCKRKKRLLRSELNAKICFTSKAVTFNEKQQMLDRRKKEFEKLHNLRNLQESTDYEGIMEELQDSEEPEIGRDGEVQANLQYLSPVEAKAHLQQVWKKERQLLEKVMGILNVAEDKSSCPVDVFFLDVIPVAPSRFRPISRRSNLTYEHEQTFSLSKVLTSVWAIKEILVLLRDEGSTDITETTTTKVQDDSKEKLQAAWLKLQVAVNCVFDGDADKLTKDKDKRPGVKQLLEKKDGLFRKHMMGKRVNFAARSVISPDPFINTNEIGIPDIFAKKLTYPQPVTPWNFQEMKQAVINGPDVHPGAVMVENENGLCVLLKAKDRIQREAIAKQLLTPPSGKSNHGKSKKVYRHLKNGDVLLLNRQPTLHRSSIQAHKARILPGQKTLRLHYANCKAYNADFDGDEMNAHFPQNEIGRAEAYNLMLTDYNYLVPKDGTPLAGLIQDHMVSGVQLMMRGRHFTKADYQQLVYAALIDQRRKIRLLPPCMLKPQVLWSGKQVLTTLLLNIIPENKALLSLEGSAKIPDRSWMCGRARAWRAGGSPLVGNDMSESEVVIHQGELLVGVLDKGHYGPAPYGLVHSCYELYGGPVAGHLLTGLARVFTAFLHWLGFTLGVEDILVTRKGDRRRKRALEEGKLTGDSVACKALGMTDDTDKQMITRRYQEAHFAKDDGEMKDLDLQMKSQTDSIQNEVARYVMPVGLSKKFPKNNLQLMVQSGAKGSNVNCMQISCLLGQIELEGHRPPIMMSGQFLPSFLPYDTSPRAGGFVDGRFLTGIRPQEYFFHCMAGREGLIDTAVKTSRSGYLQRCIIKHLEGLVVRYDTTVRDSDGSIIQFQYGEDSVDLMKTQFLNKKLFPFLISNEKVLDSEDTIDIIKDKLKYSEPVQLPPRLKCEPKNVTKVVKLLRKRYRKWEKKHPEGEHVRLSAFISWCKNHFEDIQASFPDTGIDKTGHTPACTEAVSRWQKIRGSPERTNIEKKLDFLLHQPDPFNTVLQPSRFFSSTSEKFEEIIEKYIVEDPDKLFATDGGDQKIEPSRFRNIIYNKYLQSIVQPGEAVGLLAAQSIGEPSTQMTLNTFHFAGRGEMNVTLGIPRLREILMVASATLKTPNMDIPVLSGSYAKKKAKLLQQKFNKVYLSQVLEDVEVKEYLSIKSHSEKCRMYKIRFTFLPYEMYKTEYYLTPARILSYMEKIFFTNMGEAIKKQITEMSQSRLLHTKRLNRSYKDTGDVEATEEPSTQTLQDEDEVLDDDLNDNDAASAKLREKQLEERDYDGEEEEREQVGEEQESDVEEFVDEGALSDVSDDEHVLLSGQKLKTLKNKKTPQKELDKLRVRVALDKMYMGHDYTYDPDTETWCEMTLKFGLSNKKLDLSSLVMAEAKRSVVVQTPGITRSFLSESKKAGEEGMYRFRTQGINIKEIYNYQDFLDVNSLYTNDIHAMARTYGIEAAARVIIKEVRDVFAGYGIQVDYRHLSLIADYMTFGGIYKPFNRFGIESNASPLQKMTFETSMIFLKSATIQADDDNLNSPSSRIVVGRLVNGGTGVFDLIQPL